MDKILLTKAFTAQSFTVRGKSRYVAVPKIRQCLRDGLLLLLFLILLTLKSFGQSVDEKKSGENSLANKDRSSYLINGNVTDINRKPLSDILVHDLVTGRQVRSNKFGKFSIRVAGKGQLEFSGKSYDVKKVSYHDASPLDVSLSKKDLAVQIFPNSVFITRVSRRSEDKGDLLFFIDSLPNVIRGKVTDIHDKPLSDILVHDLVTDRKTKSNKLGEFSISVATKGQLELSGKNYEIEKVSYYDASPLVVQMHVLSQKIEAVNISTDLVRDNPTKYIDLSHKGYMNLSQVLQGTIPGLSMQYVNITNRQITSVDVVENTGGGIQNYELRRYTEEQFVGRFGRDLLNELLRDGSRPGFTVNAITNVTNTMVPQIRGVNNFAEAAATMLVVIDGFPQESFPADYPMVNVESIEVERDPKELLKWGPEAAGGAIFIKTKAAKKGQMNVTYSMNMYYSPAVRYNREDLHLASTSEYLDYLYDMNTIYTSYGFGEEALQLSPAKQILNDLNSNFITTARFNEQWDSLRMLDNTSQIALLQQNQFNQNHTLMLSGGVKQYSFTLAANYIKNQTQALTGYNETFNLNLNNNFSLLKNKMNITWLVNYSNATSRTGYSFTPTAAPLEPYQMLLDAQGNYVYDYSVISTRANQLIMENGYRNHGVNLLEDALGTNSTNTIGNLRSNFNLRYNILKGLTFNAAFQYASDKTTINNLRGRETSDVRQLVNNYGELTTSGVNFYVPYGDILQRNYADQSRYNLRTNLSYAKKMGKHSVHIGLGAGGAASSTGNSASRSLYGYNERTDTGTPIFLSATNNNAAITNYASLIGLGSTATPSMLLVPTGGDTSAIRNLNINGELSYTYSDRIKMTANYIGTFNPIYGAGEYSTLSSYRGDITGLVARNVWGIFQRISLSVGGYVTQMPDAPATYSGVRYQQAVWNNFAVWVNDLSVGQQTGQRSANYYQKLNISMLDSALFFNVGYNTQHIQGNVNTTSYESTSRADLVNRYPSAGLGLNLRKRLLTAQVDYSRSPEGTTQVNGNLKYDIANESYFKLKSINQLEIRATLQNISAFQGLELMMGTNTVSGNGFGAATVTDLSVLPPSNITFEAGVAMSTMERKYTFDFRYYNQRTSGLNSAGIVVTDPATGVSSSTSYSTMSNRGVELFFKDDLVRKTNWGYSATLNGAYNKNIAVTVPTTQFVANSAFARAMREGYSVDNIWTLNWAGLSNEGEPQYYDREGNVTQLTGDNSLDSAGMAEAMVYAGVTRAPWNGGFIQDFRYKSFFARVALTFSLGHVMRYYLPYAGNNEETHELIADIWKNPGDEQYTDIAVASTDANSSREFVARYSSNSILPADNVRLQEVMLGYNFSSDFTKRYLGMKSLTVTAQVQNIAAWYKNEYDVDPISVSTSGQIGFRTPTTYSCSLSARF